MSSTSALFDLTLYMSMKAQRANLFVECKGL